MPFSNKDNLGDIEYLCQNMRHRLTYLSQAAGFADIPLKCGHTSDPNPQESNAEPWHQYLWLSCSFCYQVFAGLWLKFRHTWGLQSSPKWGCWICMKANFDKLRLNMDVSFQPRHAWIATNQPQKHMYAVCSPLHIFVCYMLIIFFLTLNQWTQYTQMLIYQHTSHLGAHHSSWMAFPNIWINAWPVCEGSCWNAFNCQLCVNSLFNEDSPAELNHECTDLAN